MTGLTTIVGRELRQVARRKTLHRLRVGAGLGAILLSFAILLAEFASSGATNPGREVFAAMVVLSCFFNLIAGPIFAANAISEEKREGTLGLLMLTPLHDYEVVGGKFVSLLLPGIQAMLATLPVFGLSFFMGGVAMAEFGRALLILTLSLLLSIAVSLGISCFVRSAVAGLAGSATVLLALVVMIPVLRFDSSTGMFTPGGISRISPAHALELVPAAEYGANPGEFWATAGWLFLISAAAILLGGFAVSRSWRDGARQRARTRLSEQ